MPWTGMLPSGPPWSTTIQVARCRFNHNGLARSIQGTNGAGMMPSDSHYDHCGQVRGGKRRVPRGPEEADRSVGAEEPEPQHHRPTPHRYEAARGARRAVRGYRPRREERLCAVQASSAASSNDLVGVPAELAHAVSPAASCLPRRHPSTASTRDIGGEGRGEPAFDPFSLHGHPPRGGAGLSGEIVSTTDACPRCARSNLKSSCADLCRASTSLLSGVARRGCPRNQSVG